MNVKVILWCTLQGSLISSRKNNNFEALEKKIAKHFANFLTEENKLYIILKFRERNSKLKPTNVQ